MSRKLLFCGVEYPLQFNFLVFKNWERETGKKLSQLGVIADESGAVEAVDALTLLYFAVQDACEENEIEFNYSLKAFVRKVDMTKLQDLISLIDLTDGEGSENKGQPAKKSLE
jgi:hypothetical protein